MVIDGKSTSSHIFEYITVLVGIYNLYSIYDITTTNTYYY